MKNMLAKKRRPDDDLLPHTVLPTSPLPKAHRIGPARLHYDDPTTPAKQGAGPVEAPAASHPIISSLLLPCLLLLFATAYQWHQIVYVAFAVSFHFIAIASNHRLSNPYAKPSFLPLLDLPLALLTSRPCLPPLGQGGRGQHGQRASVAGGRGAAFSAVERR